LLSRSNKQNQNRVANQIREGKEHQIRSIQGSGSEDFTSLDMYLAKLYRKGPITSEKAMHYCQDQKASNRYDQEIIHRLKG
jgi:Tfp pilus assembly pilus retraction ATPase PilT